MDKISISDKANVLQHTMRIELMYHVPQNPFVVLGKIASTAQQGAPSMCVWMTAACTQNSLIKQSSCW